MCVCVFYVYPESIKVTYPTHFILLYSTLSVLYMPPPHTVSPVLLISMEAQTHTTH